MNERVVNAQGKSNSRSRDLEYIIEMFHFTISFAN